MEVIIPSFFIVTYGINNSIFNGKIVPSFAGAKATSTAKQHQGYIAGSRDDED